MGDNEAMKPKPPTKLREYLSYRIIQRLEKRREEKAAGKAAKAERKESERLKSPLHIVGIAYPDSGIASLCERYRKSIAGMDEKQVLNLIKLIYNHMKAHEIDGESAKAMSLMIAKLYAHPAVQRRFSHSNPAAIEGLKNADRILYDAMRYARGVVGFGDVPALQQQMAGMRFVNPGYAWAAIKKAIASEAANPADLLAHYNRNWTAAAGPAEKFLLNEHLMGIARIAGVKNKGSVSATTRVMGIPVRGLSPAEQAMIVLEFHGKVEGAPHIPSEYGRAAAVRDGIIRNRLAGTPEPAKRNVVDALLRAVQSDTEGKLKSADDAFKEAFGNEKAMAGVKKQAVKRIDDAEARAIRMAEAQRERAIAASKSQKWASDRVVSQEVAEIRRKAAESIDKLKGQAKARREAVEAFFKQLAEASTRRDMVKVLSKPPHEARDVAVFLRGGVDNSALAQQIEAARILHPTVLEQIAAGEANIESRGGLVRGVIPVVKGKAKRAGLAVGAALGKAVVSPVAPAVEEIAAGAMEKGTAPRRTGRAGKKAVIGGLIVAGGYLAVRGIMYWSDAEQRREMGRMAGEWGVPVTKTTLTNTRSSPIMEMFYARMKSRRNTVGNVGALNPDNELELARMMEGRPTRMPSYLNPSALASVMAEAAAYAKKKESELDKDPTLVNYKNWLKDGAYIYRDGKWIKATDKFIKAHLTWLVKADKTEAEIDDYRNWLSSQPSIKPQAEAWVRWAVVTYPNQASQILNELDVRTRVMRRAGEQQGGWRARGLFVTEGEIFIDQFASDLRLGDKIRDYLKTYEARGLLVLAWAAIMDGSLPRTNAADFINEMRKNPAAMAKLNEVFEARQAQRKRGQAPFTVWQSVKDAGVTSGYLLEHPIPKDSLMDIYDQRAVKYPNKYRESFMEMLAYYRANEGIRNILNEFKLKDSTLMIYGDIAKLAMDVSGGAVNYEQAVANHQVADKVFSRLGITALIDPEGDMNRIRFVYEHSEGNTGLIRWLRVNERNIRNGRGVLDYFMGDSEFEGLKSEAAEKLAESRAKKELQRFWRGHYIPTSKKAAGPVGPNPLEVVPRLLVKVGEAPASAPAITEAERGIWQAGGTALLRTMLVGFAADRGTWRQVARNEEKAKRIMDMLKGMKLTDRNELAARDTLVAILGEKKPAARSERLKKLAQDGPEATLLVYAITADIEARGPKLLEGFIRSLGEEKAMAAEKDIAKRAKLIEEKYGIKVTYSQNGAVAGVEAPSDVTKIPRKQFNALKTEMGKYFTNRYRFM